MWRSNLSQSQGGVFRLPSTLSSTLEYNLQLASDVPPRGTCPLSDKVSGTRSSLSALEVSSTYIRSIASIREKTCAARDRRVAHAAEVEDDERPTKRLTSLFFRTPVHQPDHSRPDIGADCGALALALAGSHRGMFFLPKLCGLASGDRELM